MNISSPESISIREPDQKDLQKESNPLQDKILVNISAEFDSETIINVENELQKTLDELKEEEFDYFGIIIYFYDEDSEDKYTANFRTEATFETEGEATMQIMELISHLGGNVIE